MSHLISGFVMENDSDKLEQAHKEHLGMFVSDFLVLLI